MFGWKLLIAAFAGALNGNVTNSAQEEHDYADYDAERNDIHFQVKLKSILFFIFIFSDLFFLGFKKNESDVVNEVINK